MNFCSIARRHGLGFCKKRSGCRLPPHHSPRPYDGRSSAQNRPNQVVFAAESQGEDGAPVVSKPKRGRPRKTPLPAAEGGVSPSKASRAAGKATANGTESLSPSQTPTSVSIGAESAQQVDNAGAAANDSTDAASQPQQVNNAGAAATSGTSAASATHSADKDPNVETKTSQPKRKRGRPPKSAAASTSAAASSVEPPDTAAADSVSPDSAASQTPNQISSPASNDPSASPSAAAQLPETSATEAAAPVTNGAASGRSRAGGYRKKVGNSGSRTNSVAEARSSPESRSADGAQSPPLQNAKALTAAAEASDPSQKSVSGTSVFEVQMEQAPAPAPAPETSSSDADAAGAVQPPASQEPASTTAAPEEAAAAPSSDFTSSSPEATDASGTDLFSDDHSFYLANADVLGQELQLQPPSTTFVAAATYINSPTGMNADNQQQGPEGSSGTRQRGTKPAADAMPEVGATAAAVDSEQAMRSSQTSASGRSAAWPQDRSTIRDAMPNSEMSAGGYSTGVSNGRPPRSLRALSSALMSGQTLDDMPAGIPDASSQGQGSSAGRMAGSSGAGSRDSIDEDAERAMPRFEESKSVKQEPAVRRSGYMASGAGSLRSGGSSAVQSAAAAGSSGGGRPRRGGYMDSSPSPTSPVQSRYPESRHATQAERRVASPTPRRGRYMSSASSSEALEPAGPPDDSFQSSSSAPSQAGSRRKPGAVPSGNAAAVSGQSAPAAASGRTQKGPGNRGSAGVRTDVDAGTSGSQGRSRFAGPDSEPSSGPGTRSNLDFSYDFDSLLDERAEVSSSDDWGGDDAESEDRVSGTNIE